MESGGPSDESMFNRPLPPTGHPLGVLARVWILFWGLFGGGAVGGLALMLFVEWASLAIFRVRASDQLAIGAAVTGCAAGVTCGIFVSYWLMHRLTGFGVNVILLTMGFIPFAGVVIHAIHALCEAIIFLRRRSKRRP